MSFDNYMKKVFYITGNNYKFKKAEKYAKDFNVSLIQKKLKIKEIQSNLIKDIAKDKAEQAYNIFKKPLVVSDSGWSIPSLGGFPGPYMHYVNEWFSVKDFLNLMRDKKDKTIILEHIICAASKKGFKLFREEIKGFFVGHEEGSGLPSDRVVRLDGFNQTIAKCQNLNKDSFNTSNLWEKVYGWLDYN